MRKDEEWVENEISCIVPDYINMSVLDFTETTGVITQDFKWWITSSYKHIYIPNSYAKESVIKIEGTSIVFLKSIVEEVNNNYVSRCSDGSIKSDGEYTIPADCAYIYVLTRRNNVDLTNTMSVSVREPSQLSQELSTLRAEQKEISDKVDINDVAVMNALDPDSCIKDVRPDTTSGKIDVTTEANGYVLSDIIEVEEGETYTVSQQGYGTNIFFANNNKDLVGNTTVTAGVSFVIPSGVKYMRYSFTHVTSDSDLLWKNRVMLIKGNEVPNYFIPYSCRGLKSSFKMQTAKLPQRPCIVLSFDAIEPNVFFSSRKTICDDYGFKATVTLAPSVFTNDFAAWRNSEDEALYKTLVKEGFDFAYYPAITALDSNGEEVKTEAEWIDILGHANARLEQLGVCNMTALHCSGTKLSPNLYNAMRKTNYRIARAAQGQYLAPASAYCIFDEGQTWYVTSSSSVTSSTTSNTFTTLVDRAISTKTCVVILMHQVLDTTEPIDSYNCYESVVRQGFAYLKEKVDAGLIDVVTFRELYHILSKDKAEANDYNRLVKYSFNN